MATYQHGILGPFSGKIGQVVGTSWNGIPVMRSLPVRKKIEPSAKQQDQRARFVMMNGFLRPLTELLRLSFGNKTKNKTPFNQAFSANIKAAEGLYPALTIDYTKICLSKGKLPLGEPPSVASDEPGKLLLTWKIGDGINQDLTFGTAFIAAYSDELNRWIYKTHEIIDGQTSCLLDVVPFMGRPAHVYIGFIAKGKQKTAESRYMGLINVLSSSV
jgi:Family of unknown function (DUF6266)